MNTPTPEASNVIVFYPTTLKDGQELYTRHREPDFWCCHHHVPALDRGTYRKAICIHEAGHTVVALVSGMRVKSVSVSESEGNIGCGLRAEFEGTTTPDAYELPRSSMIKIWGAGERAEQRWLRENGLWTEDRGWAAEMGALGDRQQAIPELEAWLGTTNEGTVLMSYAELGDQVEHVLDRNWEAVRTIASALDAAGELTGDEAATLSGIPNPSAAIVA
ncbi:hypothetical protein ABZS95_43030 [Streptomyces sp. NPDC005479]|uniref:hypothetical protein n=1 Tax=unclassified Streptomyces TaxID=2593676 RepID=UPI0033B306C0